MRWLSNTFDPSHPDAFKYGPTPLSDQTQEEAFLAWKGWLAGKVIGPPKATNKYTVEQLRAMNYVGVYTR